MAKKTRIDRRGKIRSIVKPWNFPNNKPHWSITKRAAVWERRRIVDDLALFDIVTATDALVLNLVKSLSDGATIEDIVSIGGEKIIISSTTIADSGGISKAYEAPATASGVSAADAIVWEYAKALSESLSLSDSIALNMGVNKSESLSYSEVLVKDFAMPSLAESLTFSDSIGFEIMNPSGVFNVSKINDFYFNGVGDDQEFYTDSITTSDSVVLSYELKPTESVTMSDSISFDIRLNLDSDSVTISDIQVFSSDPNLFETVTMSDAVALNATLAKSSSASVSDSLGFNFMPSSVFNVNSVNLSQLNG